MCGVGRGGEVGGRGLGWVGCTPDRRPNERKRAHPTCTHDQVLPPFDPEMAVPLYAHMRSKGCTLHLGDGVAGFEQGEGGRGVVVKTQAGTRYPADRVMLVRSWQLHRCSGLGHRLPAWAGTACSPASMHALRCARGHAGMCVCVPRTAAKSPPPPSHICC